MTLTRFPSIRRPMLATAGDSVLPCLQNAAHMGSGWGWCVGRVERERGGGRGGVIGKVK